MKTQADLESENADLRARLTRAEKTIDRLLAEPPKVEVHKEVVKEFVPYPVAPMYPAPAPFYPVPTMPWDYRPWWEVQPYVGPGVTWTVAGAAAGANAGCAPLMLGTVWVGESNAGAVNFGNGCAGSLWQ